MPAFPEKFKSIVAASFFHKSDSLDIRASSLTFLKQFTKGERRFTADSKGVSRLSKLRLHVPNPTITLGDQQARFSYP